MKNLNRKISITLILSMLSASLIFFSNAGIAQERNVLMNETFDYSVGTLPPGWSVIGNGASSWGVYNSNSAGGTSPQMQFYYAPSFVGESRLMTHVLNSGAETTFKLSLNIFFYYYGLSHTIKIGYSTDNGATWTDFWQQVCTSNYGPQSDEHTFNIPANTNFRLGFYYSGDNYNIYDYNLDNVKVEVGGGVPPVPPLLIETFNYSVGTLPPGWSVMGSGASSWGIYNNNSAGGASPQMRLYYDPSFVGESRLMTHVLNSGAATTLKLSLNIFFNYYGLAHTLKIGYSTDDGATWTDFWQQVCTSNYGPKIDEHTFNIPANTNFRLGFYYSGDNYNIWDYNLDNVKVESVVTPVPLSGIYYIPTGTPGYPTISAAIEDLNFQGVGGGGVTFLVATGFTESVTAPILLTATGTAGNTIVFQKNGDGINPKITRTDAGTIATTAVDAQGDGIIIIQGSDFVTFDGIDVTSQNEGIEYGYYLRKASTTNACKNVTINNSVVTMTKGTSPYVCGIYSSNNDDASLPSNGNGITVTSTDGRTENLLIIANTVQNTHCGIRLRGFNHTASPYQFLDQNNIVGQSGAGNIIQNFGGGSSAQHTNGIYVIYQTNAKMNFNIVDNTAGGGTPSISNLHGIYLNGTVGGGDVQINNNSVKLAQESPNWVYSIINNAVTCSSIEIKNNLFSFGQYKSTAPSYMIYNSSATNNVTVTGNSNLPFTKFASGNLIGYYCAPLMTHPTGGTVDISNNTFSDITMNGGTFTGINQSTFNQVITIANNSISNLSNTGNIIGILQGRGIEGSTVSNNIIENWSGGGNFTGISAGNPASNGVSVYNNVVRGITTTNTGSSLYIYGILSTFGSPCNIYQNRVYNLEANNSNATVYGIFAGSAFGNITHNIYNNFVSDLRTPITNASINLAGIAILFGTTANVFYNTVYLNAVSTGAVFGSAALYAAGSAVNPVLDLRNNILVNLSVPNGTGVTAAYRRSNSNLTNYSVNSNANCFYAGPLEDATHAVFFDGTTAYDLASYKTLVGPVRDAASFREMPPFVNITTTPYDLHMLTNTPTLCNGGALPVTAPFSVAVDFDGDFRSATTPDVGADEFEVLSVVHSLSLPAGWSGVSSYLVPSQPAMEDVFAPIANELIIAQTMSGVYYPGQNINTIGNWLSHSAYKVKTSAACQLEITGEYETNLAVQLNTGWNLLPVVSADGADPGDLFQPVNGFVIAKDVAGTGVYWPQYNINSMGNILPGKAYGVLMTAPGVVDFTGMKSSINLTVPHMRDQNLSGLEITPTPSTHTIAILPEALKSIEQGAIIGGYDQAGNCFGASVYNSETICLQVFGDDHTTVEKDGFYEGELIFFKNLSGLGDLIGLEPIFDPYLPQSDGLFTVNGLSAVTGFETITGTGNDGFGTELSIYPNPTTGLLNIAGLKAGAVITISDIHGQKILFESNWSDQSGTIDLGGFAPGVYFIKIQFSGEVMFRKIVLK